MSGPLKVQYIRTNGIRAHVIAAGPLDGPLVILLHGFPEFWYGWRRQIPVLAAAGYRVLAPDGRGYNRSDKPRGARAYRAEALVGDVIGLIDAAGRETAAVIGHDVGGAVAWALGVLAPQRVTRLAILNAPHPAAYTHVLARDLGQMRRSSYALFFQLPGLAEWALRRGDYRWLLAGLAAGPLPGGTLSATDRRRYRTAWRRPGALTGMLNWYRAAVRYPPRLPREGWVPVPTTLVWSPGDPYLSPRMAPLSMEHCAEGRLVLLDGAGHWPHHSAAEQVNALLLDFLAPDRQRAAG